jgi:F0F1-type ATP synthase assembly protein I
VQNLSIWQAVAIATELGVALAVGVLLGMFVGHFIDERLGLQVPVFMLFGAILGLASGVYSFAQMVRRFTRPRKE